MGSELVRSVLSSALLVGIRVAGALATLGYTLLMARTMTPEAVGIVWTIWSAAMIAGTLATANLGTVAMRELNHARARGETAVAAGFVRAGRQVLLVSAPLAILGFAIVQLLSAVDAEQYRTAMILAAFAIPVMGWTAMNAGLGVALDRGVASLAPRGLAAPFTLLAGLAIMVAFGLVPDVTAVVGLFALGAVVSALLQKYILGSAFRFVREVKPDTGARRDWLVAGAMLTPTRILGENLRNVIITASALVVLEEDVARLAVAFSLIAFLNFGIRAIEMTFTPKISAAYANGRTRRRDTFMAVAAGLRLAPIGLAAVVVWLYAEPVLALFGPAYVAGADAVRWFTLIPLAKAIFGPTELILQISGQRKALLGASTIGLVVLILAIVLAGASPAAGDGAMAASVARAASLAFVALQFVMWTRCLRLTEMDPSIIGAARTAFARLSARQAGPAGASDANG